MDEQQFNRLIEQYLKGELSENDRNLVDQWLDSLKHTGQQPEWSQDDEEEQARRILQHIRKSKVHKIRLPQSIPFRDMEEPTSAKDYDENRFNKLKWSLLKVAASVMLVISSVYAFYMINSENSEIASVTENLVTASTDKGEKMKIELPDGSTVLLNSLSAITYAEAFSDSVRLVELTGEAFFEVQRNEQKPFIVKTGDLSTRVLGTSFNIRYRNNENQIQVALLSGSVNIATPDENLILENGDLVVFDRAKIRTTIKTSDYLKDFAWKDGILHFDHATWPEVKQKLEIWYGVKIHMLGNSYKRGHFTGSFNNENLRNVLEGLSFTFGFTYQQKNKDVSIQF